MQEKVFEYIKNNSMIDKGDRVLIALSGGPDSICLLHILNSLKDKLNIKIFAAHVNHCLRADEADRDEEYARKFCEDLGIDFYVKKIDIDRVSRERKISTEMAGREERYRFFDELKASLNIEKIAIAHNANDQAETLIMRIARGTGIDGLVGIRPVRDKIYIRPILSLTRVEIENYCEANKLNPRIDKSNLEEIYSRNKIRLKAIPFIEENFNKDIINALNRLAYSASNDIEFINEVVSEKYYNLVREERDFISIEKETFLEKEAILTRIIRKALVKISGVSNNFEMKHIQDIKELQKGETGKKINLTNKVIVLNEYGKIKIIKESLKQEAKTFKETKFDIEELANEKIKVINNNFGKFTFQLLNNENLSNTKGNSYEKYFNIDNIKEISIRNRKDGDTIIPFGMNGKKKLKDILINNKVPKDERDNIPLVIFDENIAWIVGLRNSDLYKIKRSNKKLLKVNYERRE